MSRPYANEQSFPTAELEADAARYTRLAHERCIDALNYAGDRAHPALAMIAARDARERLDRALAKLEELEARRKEQAEQREAVAS